MGPRYDGAYACEQAAADCASTQAACVRLSRKDQLVLAFTLTNSLLLLFLVLISIFSCLNFVVLSVNIMYIFLNIVRPSVVFVPYSSTLPVLRPGGNGVAA
jgi:hypothetical protein